VRAVTLATFSMALFSTSGFLAGVSKGISGLRNSIYYEIILARAPADIGGSTRLPRLNLRFKLLLKIRKGVDYELLQA
jgi:hypothetical protein